MSKDYKVAGYFVSHDLYRRCHNIKARGGKAYISFPGGGPGDCENCKGNGNQVLQTVHGGPFSRVPETRMSGKSQDVPADQVRVATVINGEWYLVNNLTFTCPVCHGTGRTGRRLIGEGSQAAADEIKAASRQLQL